MMTTLTVYDVENLTEYQPIWEIFKKPKHVTIDLDYDDTMKLLELAKKYRENRIFQSSKVDIIIAFPLSKQKLSSETCNKDNDVIILGDNVLKTFVVRFNYEYVYDILTQTQYNELENCKTMGIRIGCDYIAHFANK